MKYTIVILLFLSTLFSSQYKIDNGKGYYKSKSGKFSLEIEYLKKSDEFKFSLIGKTDGWISIGFGQERKMKDGEIYIGFVKDGKVYFEHHYGTSSVSHKKIKDFNNFKVLEFEKKDKFTKIVFKRSASNYDKDFQKKLKSGDEINFMYAIGRKPNFRLIHSERGSEKIKLP
ncbi:MAG: hypothetical protein CR982_08775 [Candidatus Cloacimonadota bacterium]|nr:MAG: hypothetical protein CR982_08775 [Candidatus Cloacimonadota bacterium]PIE77727.1 MAG: hypothetical protein CSA15_11430 [Candidatus Delongbacteria bacterium]